MARAPSSKLSKQEDVAAPTRAPSEAEDDASAMGDSGDEGEESAAEMGEEEEEEDDGDDGYEATQDLNQDTTADGGARLQKGMKSVKKLTKPTGDKPSTSLRKKLQLDLAPAAIRRRIVQERFTPATSMSTGVFLAAAVETFMRELIDTAVSVANERKRDANAKIRLTVQDIQRAVKMDEEFANIFQNVMFATHSVKSYETGPVGKTKNKVAPAGSRHDEDDE